MADLQRKTANLFDLASWIIANGATYTKDGESYTFDTKQSMFSTPFYFSNTDIDVSISGIIESITVPNPRLHLLHANGTSAKSGALTPSTLKSENISCAGLKLDWSGTGGTVKISNLMLNTGSTAKPYEPYGWLHSLRKLTTATDTITTLPADVYADGTNASVDLVGNMSQTGTPTPQNPIQPSECGEMTENLFDEIYASHTGSTVIYKPVYVGDGTFTLSSDIPQLQGAGQLFLLSGDVTSGASTKTNDVHTGLSRTVSSTDGYVTIGYRQYSVSAPDVANYNVMLNAGSAALPHEPHGYKLDIKSGNTTTPVYLGQVQSTRRIKKLVLTGQEDWVKHSTINTVYRLAVTDYLKIIGVTSYNSHYAPQENVGNPSSLNDLSACFYSYSATPAFLYYIKDSRFDDDINGFKAYLTQQYANGTPVTVWYVLASPETAVVNEPLRKIGNYADTVSDITIPTITGKDTFDVLTTLKPSEVELTYTGWHDASVKEKSENLFDKSASDKDTTGYIQSDGSIALSQNYYVSGYIDISDLSNVTISSMGTGVNPAYCLYNANKQYVSGNKYNNVETITVNITTEHYIRFSYKVANENTTMLNTGSTALPYEPYWT